MSVNDILLTLLVLYCAGAMMCAAILEYNDPWGTEPVLGVVWPFVLAWFILIHLPVLATRRFINATFNGSD